MLCILPEPPMIDQVALQTIRCLVRKAIRQRRFPRDEFDDLVQEIVLKLLMKMDQFDPLRSCWSTFCAMVARQHMSDRQKRDAHRIATDSIEHLPTCASNEPVELRTPSNSFRRMRSQYEWFELSEDVTTMVDRLPEPMQELCGLICEHETVTEVASYLNVSRQTVYRRCEVLRQSIVCESLAEYR